MFKALMVPVLATGLAFSGSAKQAEALTAEEVAAIAAGLIIVGAIASHSNNNNKATTQTVTRNANVHRNNSVRNLERRRILPANCVRRFDTDRGVRNLAIQRCLQRNGYNAARLPDRCEVRVRTDRGPRNAFRKRCLENAGYRFRNIQRTNDGRVILDARSNR